MAKTNAAAGGDGKKRGTIGEFKALSIAIMYGFKHFMGANELTIDVQAVDTIRQELRRVDPPAREDANDDRAKVMPDFAIRRSSDRKIVAYGECKYSSSNEQALLRQLKEGVVKLKETVVARRFLLMPVETVVDLTGQLRKHFPGVTIASPVVFGKSHVHYYSFKEDGVFWDIFEYRIGYEDTVCGVIVTESHTSGLQSLVRLGHFLQNKICNPLIDEITVGRTHVGSLEKENLLPGHRPEEENQLKLLISDAWSYLTQEYLIELAKETSSGDNWITVFQRVFNSAQELGAPQLEVPSGTIPPMRPTFTLADQEQSKRLPLGVMVPERTRDQRTMVILEADSGMGKSVSMAQEANLLAEAMLHSGGLVGVSALPFHLDLKRTDLSILGSRIEQSKNEERPTPLDEVSGAGVEFLATYFVRQVCSPILSPNDRSAVIEEDAITALLCRNPLILIIDGYDHLVSIGREEYLAPLLENLRHQGVDIVRVIVTSRVGYRAVSALRPLQDMTVMQISLQQFRELEQSQYLQRWLDYISSRETHVARHTPIAEAWPRFRHWLRTKTSIQGSDRLETLCRSNALLINIAIIVFILTGDEESDSKLTEAAFIDELFDRVLNYATAALANATITPQDKADRLARLDLTSQRHNRNRNRVFVEWLSFILLCRPAKQVGSAEGSTLVDDRGKQTSVQELILSHGMGRVLDGSLPVIKYSDVATLSEGNRTLSGRLEYLHPAFHEFFAGCFLARKLHEGKVPGVSGDIALEDAIDPHGDASITFQETVRQLGPAAIKYAAGMLVEASLRENGMSAGLRRFLSLIRVNPSLQQYLYDAAFLDEMINELHLINAELCNNMGQVGLIILVKKLLGHVLYGSIRDDEKTQSLSLMKEALKLLETEEEESALRFFLRNHIWNRSKPYKREDEEELTRMIEHDLETPPPSEMHQLLFRAGVFWGHVGNQRLIAMTAAAKNRAWAHLAVEFDKASESFWKAAVYRYCCLPPTTDDETRSKLLEEMTKFKVPPAWLQQIQQKLAMSSVGYETSMVESQAIGDIANQFAGLSQVNIWRYIYLKTQDPNNRNARDAALDNAKNAEELSRLLWENAITKGNRDSVGGIKYYIWFPATKFGLEIIIDDNLGRSTSIPESQVRDSIQKAINYAGVRYAIAETGVLHNVEVMQKALAAN